MTLNDDLPASRRGNLGNNGGDFAAGGWNSEGVTPRRDRLDTADETADEGWTVAADPSVTRIQTPASGGKHASRDASCRARR